MFLSISCGFLATNKAYAVVYLVNGTGDGNTGAGTTGTLRYCINQANAAGVGPHTINFTGLAAGTITLTATLPTFARQILVMGNTSAGPIEISGNGAIQRIFFLNDVNAANSTIRGLTMNRATLRHIEIIGVNGMTIQDCKIGTNVAGTAGFVTNPNFGIFLVGVTGTTIVGNTISDHTEHGVFFDGGSANTIRGNKIGTDINGTIAIPNTFHGIQLVNSANNIIGGAAAADRNIISGNSQQGISVLGTSNGVQIINNHIGTNLLGTADLGNNEHGIFITTGTSAIITNNVISGNNAFGVHILNSNGHTIRGNKIGVNAAGNAAIGNTLIGLRLENSNNAIIGGATAGQGNVLSGNGEEGLFMFNCSSTSIRGNFIGTNGTGAAAIGNGRSGVNLINCISPIIGGAATGETNVISGNTQNGLLMGSCPDPIIRGNFLGTNAVGTAVIPNTGCGLYIINSARPIIGGTLAGELNVISGNVSDGIRFENSSNALIQGNFIGTNISGTAALRNQGSGIAAYTTCNFHLIGGSVLAARNIISGNNGDGIFYDGGCSDLTIQNNYVGTNATGTGPATTFGNGRHGISINNGCLRATIGGTTAIEQNIASGNGRLWSTLGDNGTGIFMSGGCHDARIRGNYVGVALDGSALGNRENGISVINGCNNVLFGGTTATTRNIVSNNSYQGINLLYCDAPIIIGNYCGTNIAGTAAMGNGSSGVILIFVYNARVGRAATDEGNILSGNGELGLHIVGGSGNIAYNNLIGVALNKTTALGNRNGGVFIQGVGGGVVDGSNNTIGGLGLLEPNIIANSTGVGVAKPFLGNGFGIGVAHDDKGIQNTFIGNKIYCNAALGIDLNFANSFGGAGVDRPGNGGKPAPAITAVTATSTSGTGINGETIHVYSNVTCTTCQGETYLGSAVVAGGVWSVTHAAVAVPSNNSATATSAALGTSQFSCNFALPVTLIYFKARAQGSTALLTWATGMEKDNAGFAIERSADGIHFEQIAYKEGNGNTQQLSNYSHVDEQPLNGISYYRLKQLDYNGAFTYSALQSVVFNSNNTFYVFPNPATDQLHVVLDEDQEYYFHVYTNLGVELKNLHIERNGASYSIDLTGVATGSYILEVSNESSTYTKQFLVY